MNKIWSSFGPGQGPIVIKIVNKIVNKIADKSQLIHVDFDKLSLTRSSTKLFTMKINYQLFVQVKWETIDKFPKSRLQKLRYATTQCEFTTLNLSPPTKIPLFY